ncbi:MAG: hypothetical protein VKI81_00375 [Synechococcaceae cyanobacterium]|nr:hypothetical protein [Synechococcaceae cyanobacterium]
MAGAMAVVLLLLLALLPAPPARALSLPGWGKRSQPAARMGEGPSTVLQEVAPPAAVQQLRARLSDRHPRLAIEAPSDGALLPAGPWTLRLAVEDWPLVEEGPLGAGPHLLVQVDDDPPLRLTRPEVTMPPLSPGSHRLTVHAAWPWGEALKSPGAWRQIRLHRVAADPLGLPAPGTPQLLAVSPAEPLAAEPVLIDWELIDAPLQNLREGDIRWKLRITVNGDGFLVDRHQPLWLKGWRRGSNALLLELVDPRGEPLNPPYNSLVREVTLDPSLERPRWLGGRLTEAEIARLLGEAPPETGPALPSVGGEEEERQEPLGEEPEPQPVAEPAAEPEPEPEPEPAAEAEPEPVVAEPQPEPVAESEDEDGAERSPEAPSPPPGAEPAPPAPPPAPPPAEIPADAEVPAAPPDSSPGPEGDTEPAAAGERPS